VGRAILVTPEYEGYIVGSDIIRLRLVNSDICPEYLYYFMITPRTRAYIARHASGTTMPGINEKILNKIEIPVTTRDKQSEIVQAVEEMNQVEGVLQNATTVGANLLYTLANHITSQR
jgi:type I restriction enzyme, S subunit